MLRILYIDDFESSRFLFEEIFNQAGHEVDAVNDALEGLELLNRKKYDLIVCDVIMPVTDGITFIKELSITEIETPVILTSAAMSLYSLEDYHGLKNYLGFLLKPLEPDKVVELYNARNVSCTA